MRDKLPLSLRDGKLNMMCMLVMHVPLHVMHCVLFRLVLAWTSAYALQVLDPRTSLMQS